MRRRPARGDDGFVLPYVMLVIMLVTVAVSTLLVVVTPDTGRVRADQAAQGASAAARAAIDDFIAYVGGVDACRTTTRVCPQALGASSTTLRGGATVLDATTKTTMSWTTDAALVNGLVRVHGVGGYGTAIRQLTADVALAPSILSYGYYSDYESQNPQGVASANPLRAVYVDNATYYQAIGRYVYATANDGSRTVVVQPYGFTAPIVSNWAGVSAVPPTSSQSSPTYPADCDTHWWNDGSVVGRAKNGSSWSDTATLRNASDNASRATVGRTGTCNIVFTTGQTFDGPVYSRDALYLTQATVGGQGPVFLQPVLTGWGLTGHDTPQPDPAKPWVRGTTTDSNGNTVDLGTLSDASQRPKIANFDLTLPPSIGTEGVAADACRYYGPTRTMLNRDGTVTVTSPATIPSRVTGNGSDPSCYPSDLGTGGVTAYRVPAGAGHGTMFAKDYGTKPSTGWPGVGTKVGVTTPSSTSSVFYTSASGGVVDRANSTAAGDTCGTYAATVNAACAWTELPSFSSTSGGWTANSTTSKCNTTNLASTDQRRFECEYSYGTTSTAQDPSKTYDTFRAAAKNAVASQCLTGTVADRTTCLTTALNGLLPKSTAWRYVVTGTPTVGTAVSGTAVTAPGTPTSPFATDPLFDTATITAQQTPTTTPVTFVVGRQTSSDGGRTFGTTATGAFSLTASLTQWALTPGTATSWFPKVADVNVYSAATSSAGPGDLYVQGENAGKHSLLADNDVVVTGDVVDISDNVDNDAVNLVAGRNVRNQNPVRCDATATTTGIARTAPGFCPNDLFGLPTTFTAGSNGTLDASHPANRYVNMNPLGDRRIDAAVFALQGSFQSDSYYRGAYVGKVTINGGLYQKYRGTNGVNYTLDDKSVAKIGYSLNYHYVDLRKAYLPYEPTTRSASGRLWTVTAVYGSGPS